MCFCDNSYVIGTFCKGHILNYGKCTIIVMLYVYFLTCNTLQGKTKNALPLFQILAGKRPCASYDAELLRVKTSPEMRRYNEEHADLYRYTSEQSGSNIHDPESLEFLCNTLFIEELYNLTLPNWTKSVYPQKMMSVSSYSFTVPAKTRLLQRLKIGKLVGDYQSSQV